MGDPRTFPGPVTRCPPASGEHRGAGWLRLTGRAASLVVTAALFWALLDRVADLGEVVDVIRREIGWGEAAALATLTASSLLASFTAMTAALPGLRLRDAAQVNVTTTAVAYGVPGGGAAGTVLTAAMLRDLGFGTEAITLEVLVTGLWNLAAKAGLPLVALAALGLSGGEESGLVVAGLAASITIAGGAVLAWGFFHDERVAARVGRTAQHLADRARRALGRAPAGDAVAALVQFRADAVGLVRARGWLLSFATCGYHLSLFGVLVMALDSVDARGVSVIEALAVFAVARQLSAVPLTPGGAGVVELGMVAGLEVAGGDLASVTAAVLVFRSFTFWSYLPAGPALWVAWRSRHRPDAEHEPGPIDEVHMRYYRHPGDIVRLFGGIGVVVAVGVLAAGGRMVRAEVDFFRLVNDLPDALHGPVWAVMQAGWVGAVPLAAAAALTFGRRRLALDLAVGGLGAWVAAKGVKLAFHRGRPGELLNEVLLRGVSEGGHGFVSGHAAVAAALATVAAGHVSRRVRWLAWVGVWAVAASRVYVGAHLPFDVIGGAALGWTVGAIVHLARGTPGHVPTPGEVADALTAAGRPVMSVEPVHADARGSIPFRAFFPGGALFVKAMGADQRDADLLYRLGRFLAFRETGDEAPFATPKHQLEHEAYLAMLAARAGARVPGVVVTAETGAGMWIAAQELLDAVPLARLDPTEVNDDLLDDVWAQVVRIRSAHLAHRDLRLANVLVDGAGRSWLVDWSFAEAGATVRQLDGDVAELLAATACLVGPERAVAAGVRALGTEAVAVASRLLQPLALSAGTRRAVLAHPGLLDELRGALGVDKVGPESVIRLPLHPTVIGAVVLAAWALHHLVTRVGGVGELGEVVGSASWRWLVVAAVAAGAGYLASAIALMASAPTRLAFGRTAAVQLAASFASKMTPPGEGSAIVSVSYLRFTGVGAAEADEAVRRTRVAGLVTHVVGLGASWSWLAGAGIRSGLIPGGSAALIVAVAMFAALAIALWRPLGRRSAVTNVLADLRALPAGIRPPMRGVVLLAGAVGVTLSRVGVLSACLWAFGAEPSFVASAGAYLAVAAIAHLGPLPGGLGTVEAGLIVALAAVGVPATPAVAGVLAYRILTFWAPIIPAAVTYRHLHRRGCF